jgi:nickel transport protein
MRLLRLPVAPGVATALAGVALLAMASTTPVRAHGIESSLETLSPLSAGSFTGPAKASRASAKRIPSDTLQLESRFSSGEPAQSATVRLVPPQGEAIVLGQTNAEGQLQFQLPSQAGSDWELQVDAGPGHRDYLELSENLMDAAASLPATAAPALVRSSLVRKVGQPQRWLDQRSQLLVGLTSVGLGAAGLLSSTRRRR